MRVRDTTDAELLATIELDRSFGHLALTSTALVISTPPEEGWYEPWWATELVIVFDPVSGEERARVPTTLQLVLVR